ncbi:hypothetical protein EZV62_019591 [Acer yangbiense]|uniref:Uncharacterized protein n=1 Tax=Acer yangbiense TaxID=1000413 RepID=A0A5C7HCM9_9ROSI|nr:hypothetical protein EZV62_019591 [Acer yangbiense]
MKMMMNWVYEIDLVCEDDDKPSMNWFRFVGRDDEYIIEKILRTLNSKFEYRVTVIVEFKDIKKMTLDELMGSLQTHEQRLDKKSKIEVEEALQSQLSLKKDRDETQEF